MASSPLLRRDFVLGLGALACLGARAQEAAPPPTLSSEMLGAGLYLISGGGGNSLLRFSANGLVLVNGKSADSYKPLMSQVRKINKLSDMPLRALILTDAQDPQAANSALFAEAKVPILAQANAASHLTGCAAALVTYERDYAVTIGGVEVLVHHFGRARTDGDAVVLFPDKKLLAVGDLYSPEDPRPGPGGSLSGWSAVLDQVLALDFERAVPNQGPAIGRDDLIAFKRKIDGLNGSQPNLTA